MKICIVSDSHDCAAPLAAAIMDAQASGAQVVIHCGDLVGVNTLRASLKLGIPIHAVHGHSHTAHIGKQKQVKGGESWLVNLVAQNTNNVFLGL
jgi:predicted phosphodiesterase